MSLRGFGYGGSASAGATLPVEEDEGGCTPRSTTQDYTRLLLQPESSTGTVTYMPMCEYIMCVDNCKDKKKIFIVVIINNNVHLIIFSNLSLCICVCTQVQLYEDFAKSRAKVNVDDVLSTSAQEDEDKPKLKATGHVFQVRNQWKSFLVTGQKSSLSFSDLYVMDKTFQLSNGASV